MLIDFVQRRAVVAASDFQATMRARSKDMLQRSEALELVSKQLEQKSSDDVQYVVVDASTIEKPFGWIFFYQSKKFLETGIIRHRLAGNGPVFVNKMTREIDFFGSIPPLDVILADYEKKLKERG